MRGVLRLRSSSLSAACAAGATAAPGLKLGITDSGDAYFAPPASFYPDLGRLHAQVLRVHLNWGGKLGVATRRPADGADPPTRPTTGAATTRSSSRAADAGRAGALHDLRHAGVGERRAAADARAACAPPTSMDFSFAAAQRYGGEFMRDDGIVLPRVRYWTAWNEPNLTIGLVPQWKRVGKHWVIQSAIDYARICNAVVDGVHGTLIPGEQVACGDTGPRGNNAPTSEPARRPRRSRSSGR